MLMISYAPPKVDFLCTAESWSLETILGKLRKSFSNANEKQECFRFLGLNVKSQNNKILLDQNHYINNTSKVLISHSRRSDSLILNENENKILQEKIGQLLQVCNQTRPYISFDTSKITSNLKNATILDLKLWNKVLSKITNDQIILKYQKLNENLRLFVYIDASFGNLKDGGSQGSYFIFLVDTDYHCNL